MSESTPSQPTTDRNLLYGMLALQLNFVGRDALIAAMQAWVFDKAKPLGQILLEQDRLTPESKRALDALVEQHLKLHGGDAQLSLAAVTVSESVSRDLFRLADDEMRDSLTIVQHKPTLADASGRAGRNVRYEVLRPHARGGIGEVFVALDQELHREVALKEIQPHFAGDAVSRLRFVQEAEITGGLEHPGIVPVYGLGQYADGRPFYAMRFIQGETLRDAVRRLHAGEAGVTPRGLLTRFVAVCNAAAYAHSRGVLHRDLKPANILLGKFGETLIVDWGLAKAIGRELVEGTDDGFDESLLRPRSGDSSVQTQLGSALGTPAYMSPEQAEGRLDLLGPAADVYSLGATLYTILTGQAPVEGSEPADVMAKVRKGDWKPARQVKADVPAALESVCNKAMAFKPGDRYPTAMALAADVESWLDDQPVSAWREPVTVQVRRWLGRHRTVVTAAAAVILVTTLALGIGVALLTAANEREHDLRAAAEQNEKVARERGDEIERNRDAIRSNLYFANMSLAQREWENGNVAHVLELLGQWTPARTGDKDLRGWEWYYQDRLCRGALRTFTGHNSEVESVAYSPDGTRLASAGEDGTVRLWDVVGGAAHVLKGHQGRVWAVAFSPDGKWLASAGADKTVRVWDTICGSERHVLRGHDRAALYVTFSPDGTRLSSCAQDGTVRLWDWAKEKELGILKGHVGEVNCVAFHPDGNRLASAGDDATIRVWDLVEGKELFSLRGHLGEANHVAFSPDGTRLASVGQDGTLRIWDAALGKEARVVKSRVGRLWGVAYSRDGTRLATAGQDGAVRLWDATCGGEVKALKGHTGAAASVAFGPDRLRLISGGLDGTVRLWDAAGEGDSRTLTGHTAMVRGLAYRPDGKRLVSAGRDGMVRLWDSAGGDELQILNEHSGGALAVTYSADGARLASAGHRGEVLLWDAPDGSKPCVLRGHESSVYTLAFNPDGSRLASAGYEGTIRLWDVVGNQEPLVLKGHKGRILHVTFSGDGATLFSGDEEGTVRLWDARCGEQRAFFKTDTDRFASFAVSPDGKRLVLGGRRGTIQLWNAAGDGEPHSLQGHTGVVHGLAFSPDGTRIASCGMDGTVRLWDAASGVELRVVKSHAIEITSVTFSPDGTRLALGRNDGTIKIIDGRPWTPEIRTEQEAVDLVEGLFARPLLKAEVIAQLCGYRGIDDEVRRKALEQSERYNDEPERFDRASREVIRHRDATIYLYRQALGWSQTACRLAPEAGPYRTSLGIAQYRLGQYTKARETLIRSAAINRDSQPADEAFLAMAHHRLGQRDEAKTLLDQLRQTMNKHRSVWSEEALGYLAEAEALLGEPSDADGR